MGDPSELKQSFTPDELAKHTCNAIYNAFLDYAKAAEKNTNFSVWDHDDIVFDIRE